MTGPACQTAPVRPTMDAAVRRPARGVLTGFVLAALVAGLVSCFRTPEMPDAASAAVAPLEIRHQAGRPRQEQVAVFAGVPAGAQKCSLGWDQGPADARDFRVEGSGLLSVQQLRDGSLHVTWSFRAPVDWLAAKACPAHDPDRARDAILAQIHDWV